MVKGISRRVIVVKSPDPRLFEEAIFIVKEEAFQRGGVSADQVVREANKIAQGYARRNAAPARTLRRFAPPLYGALGALLATALWWAAIWLQWI